MKLEFCVACGSRDDLQHHHLVAKTRGGSDAEANRITLCTSCHDKLHEQRYGASKQSRPDLLLDGRVVPASADRKLMPDQREKALQRLDSGETKAAVARSYGLSKATVNRMVRSARLSGGLAR
jgi:DNA invertase Pin-like site-specific DNA recombinase